MHADSKFSRFVLSALMLAGVCPSVARAQTFSADLEVVKPGGPTRTGRIFVSNDLVRIETPDLPGGFFIVDGRHEAAWFVQPQRWVFMDAKQSSPLTQVFVVVDPENPCLHWHAMTTVAAVLDEPIPWRCDRGDVEMLNGREVVDYGVTSLRRRRSVRWIDARRRFPIKWQDDDGTIVTLEHIVDGPQAAALFTIPPTYRKFDPLQLIQQVMLSDVWVKPPEK